LRTYIPDTAQPSTRRDRAAGGRSAMNREKRNGEMTMSFVKGSKFAIAFAVLATPAAALTIENQDKAELKVGIDEGNVEHVETIPAGKSGDLSAKCKQGCGLTGPWGFSWMAQPGDKLTFKDAKLDGATTVVTQ
jgi:hypothetical protein